MQRTSISLVIWLCAGGGPLFFVDTSWGEKPRMDVVITDFGINQWRGHLETGFDFRSAGKQFFSNDEIDAAGQILVVMPKNWSDKNSGSKNAWRASTMKTIQSSINKALDAGSKRFEIQLVEDITTDTYLSSDAQTNVADFGKHAYGVIRSALDSFKDRYEIRQEAVVGSNGTSMLLKNIDEGGNLSMITLVDGRADKEEVYRAIEALGAERIRLVDTKGDLPTVQDNTIARPDVVEEIKLKYPGVKAYLWFPSKDTPPLLSFKDWLGRAHLSFMDWQRRRSGYARWINQPTISKTWPLVKTEDLMPRMSPSTAPRPRLDDKRIAAYIEKSGKKRPAPTSQDVCVAGKGLLERFKEGIAEDLKDGSIFTAGATYPGDIQRKWWEGMIATLKQKYPSADKGGADWDKYKADEAKVRTLKDALWACDQAVRAYFIRMKNREDCSRVNDAVDSFERQLPLIAGVCPIDMSVMQQIMKRCQPRQKLPACDEVLRRVQALRSQSQQTSPHSPIALESYGPNGMQHTPNGECLRLDCQRRDSSSGSVCVRGYLDENRKFLYPITEDPDCSQCR